MAEADTLRQLHTHDLELGATEAVKQHFSRHVVATKPVSQRKLNFEHARPRWLRECMAEATGTFFYVFPGKILLGVGVISLVWSNRHQALLQRLLLRSTKKVGNYFGQNIPERASYLRFSGTACVIAYIFGLLATAAKDDAGFGSLLQIGFAFATGIAFAIITCAPTSGGHFNPAISICFAMWQGFPWKKVPYYIFSQIFGAFMAGLLLMGMYHVQLADFAASLRAQGVESMVFNGGPASVLCSFPSKDQTNLGYLFLIEFFVDSYIGIVIWATLDPANPFISPSSAPFVIGLAYGTMVWAFADINIATNLARDLGPRIVAAIFYGGEAFSYYNYSWIAILVNVPATIFATGYYELLMRDSLQKIGKGAAMHEGGEKGLALHLTRTGFRSPERGRDGKGDEKRI